MARHSRCLAHTGPGSISGTKNKETKKKCVLVLISLITGEAWYHLKNISMGFPYLFLVTYDFLIGLFSIGSSRPSCMHLTVIPCLFYTYYK